MKPGLIASRKTVVRSDTGKTHEQTYWIRPEEVRKLAREGNGLQAVDRLGGSRELAEDLIEDWVRSGTSVVRGKFMSVLMTPEQLHAFGVSLGDKRRSHEDELIEAARQQSPLWTRTIRAMIAVSQAAFDADGVDVHRGIHGTQAGEIIRSVVRGDPTPNVALHPLSSFTTDRGYADDWARSHIGDQCTISAHLPRSSIALYPAAFLKGFSGHHNLPALIAQEREVVPFTLGTIRPTSVRVL